MRSRSFIFLFFIEENKLMISLMKRKFENLKGDIYGVV